ncbi:MAG TPA: hypothetical protein VFI22_16375, partial [Thermomicrobiales bacterium]|nr:hypothetical protein [Thermomicrobiales bacterium]
SGLLRQYPLDLALAKIAETGYDGIELWGGQFHGYVLDMVKAVDDELTLDQAAMPAALLESSYRGWMSAELCILGE